VSGRGANLLYLREEIFYNPRMIKSLDRLTDEEISFLKGDVVVSGKDVTTDDLFSVIILIQGGDNLAWKTAPVGMNLKTKMALCYIDYKDVMNVMEEYNPMTDPITEVSLSALTPIGAAKKGIPYKPPKIDPNAPTLLRNIQRNTAKLKDFNRKVPEPLVIFLTIGGQEVRALIDTGSLADFVLTTVADQLKLTLEPLKKPLPCALAASGSRTMIQYSTTVEFKYQKINERRRFDVINLDSYDMILGMPFLW
jgi:hypothetical protein